MRNERNRFERRGCGHDRHFDDNRRFDEGGRFETLPHRPGMEGRFERMPLRPGMEGGFDTLPERHRGPGGHRGHGRPPFGGMPEEGLKERVEQAGLAELLELAGRMLRHRPGGDAGRGQALALSILAGREAMGQRELQQLLGVQPGSVSELVSKLEKKGLVTRERDGDRRGNLLRLTEAGRQAAPKGEADPEEALFAALTPEQQNTLAALLRALLRDWMEKMEESRPRRGMGIDAREAPVEV